MAQPPRKIGPYAYVQFNTQTDLIPVLLLSLSGFAVSELALIS